MGVDSIAMAKEWIVSVSETLYQKTYLLSSTLNTNINKVIRFDICKEIRLSPKSHENFTDNFKPCILETNKWMFRQTLKIR